MVLHIITLIKSDPLFILRLNFIWKTEMENCGSYLLRNTLALFEKNEPGTFGGRYSKILSIDIEGNLALVKAEILFPRINKRFIDVFIMKEVEEGSWLIISKAANSSLMEEE
jgi:hypothetical protein